MAACESVRLGVPQRAREHCCRGWRAGRSREVGGEDRAALDVREDAEGNVYSKRTFNDLLKQGIIKA